MIGLAIALAGASVCSAMDVGLPSPLASWTTPSTGSVITLGKASRVTLSRGPKFGVSTTTKSDPDTFGTSLIFNVAREGTYEVALSEAAWIDLVKGGVAAASPGHRHGPECSTVRKIVIFDLMKGTYTLQISGSKNPVATVVIYAPGL